MIRYLTGLSGCGKGYYVSSMLEQNSDMGEVISLDEFTLYLLDQEKNKPVIESETMRYYLQNVLKPEEKYQLEWGNDWNHYHDDFIKWLQQQDKNFFVEGIQIYDGSIAPSLLSGSEVLVIKKSLIRCAINRIIRAIREEKGLINKLKKIKHNGLIHQYHFTEKDKFDQFLAENQDKIHFTFIS